MLAVRDDGGPIDSFLELAKEFGIEVLGDQWNQLNLRYPLNEHDAYEIPPGAPDANEIRTIIDNSLIPQIESSISDLNSISDSPGDRFRIFLDANETNVFFNPNILDSSLPRLQYDLEVDYGEVLLLKVFLSILKGQLQTPLAYDSYVDPNDMLIEKIYSDCFNINTDLLNPYPDLLKVLPTPNDPNDGATILAQGRQDLINTIGHYLDAIDYICNEEDSQENDLLYIDPNDKQAMEIANNRLVILRDSLVNDTVATYPLRTKKTYTVLNENSLPIGQLVLEYNFTGLEGSRGSLTFTDANLSPSQWEVGEFGVEDANRLWIDFEYADAASGDFSFGWLEATLSADGNSFATGSFSYYDLWWNFVDMQNLSGQLDSTIVQDVNVDPNPIFGSSARYPVPVKPRDLLPEFDEWNSPLPGTMGLGLGNDPTLGGIVPDMNQYDWQVELGLQPAGLLIISPGAATMDGGISEWTSSQLVFDDISGDTEKDPNAIPGMDIDKLYMSYDSDYLYGAITFYDNISSDIDYTYELFLSYSPDDDSEPGAIRLTIEVSGGSAVSTLWQMENEYSFWWWDDIFVLEASAGLNAVEFKIPLASIPGGVPGRYISLDSWGRNPGMHEWYDGERNGTHLKIAGLGTNDLGTISGTITYDNYSGAPIFIQAYTDPWEPGEDLVASTMITAPGAYTLEGIGISWQGYVRAFTPLFGFNIFDLKAFTVEASVPVFLTGAVASNVNLVLGDPISLEEGHWVSGEIDPVYEEDWYSFNAVEGEVYGLELNEINPDTDIHIVLYDRNGYDSLEESWLWGDHIDWICPESGTYYVKVSGAYNDGGAYRIRVSEMPVRIVGHTPSGKIKGSVRSILLRFDRPMDQDSFSPDSDIVRFEGPQGRIIPAGYNWIDARTLEIFFTPLTEDGFYEMVVGSNIVDLYGKALNQDGDLVPGEAPDDQYTVAFEIFNILLLVRDNCRRHNLGL